VNTPFYKVCLHEQWKCVARHCATLSATD
jgi:hypothetical protein